jgi:hypothetical protein
MRDSSASDHPARNAAAHAAARTCTASSSALEAAASLRTVSTLADSNSSANRTACSTISAMTRTLAEPQDTPHPHPKQTNPFRKSGKQVMHFRATIHFVESGPLFGGAALG